jgi:hypothetical protein
VPPFLGASPASNRSKVALPAVQCQTGTGAQGWHAHAAADSADSAANPCLEALGNAAGGASTELWWAEPWPHIMRLRQPAKGQGCIPAAPGSLYTRDQVPPFLGASPASNRSKAALPAVQCQTGTGAQGWHAHAAADSADSAANPCLEALGNAAGGASTELWWAGPWPHIKLLRQYRKWGMHTCSTTSYSKCDWSVSPSCASPCPTGQWLNSHAPLSVPQGHLAQPEQPSP